jgi:hypothetical protein
MPQLRTMACGAVALAASAGLAGPAAAAVGGRLILDGCEVRGGGNDIHSLQSVHLDHAVPFVGAPLRRRSQRDRRDLAAVQRRPAQCDLPPILLYSYVREYGVMLATEVEQTAGGSDRHRYKAGSIGSGQVRRRSWHEHQSNTRWQPDRRGAARDRPSGRRKLPDRGAQASGRVLRDRGGWFEPSRALAPRAGTAHGGRSGVGMGNGYGWQLAPAVGRREEF